MVFTFRNRHLRSVLSDRPVLETCMKKGEGTMRGQIGRVAWNTRRREENEKDGFHAFPGRYVNKDRTEGNFGYSCTQIYDRTSKPVYLFLSDSPLNRTGMGGYRNIPMSSYRKCRKPIMTFTYCLLVFVPIVC